MEIETQSFLPLDLAVKYYAKWDCEVETKVHKSIYYKYLTGFGHLLYHNGNSYEGTIHNGLMHGKGTYTWSNGLSYQGTFSNNHANGEGKLNWLDGSYYIGRVEAGKREGQGEYFCAVDQSNYKGLWKAGLKEGKGTLTFANGSVYQGEFQKGQRQGQGKMKYLSGNEYEGTWKADKKKGEGTMQWFSSFEKFQGSWNNDLPEGKGTYYWFQNKSDTKSIKTIYKGEWTKGKREGYGAFFYNNGCRMEGTFSNNLKEGICAITDEFGDTHIEHFTNDKSTTKEPTKGEPSTHEHYKLPDPHNSKPIMPNNYYLKMVDIPSPLIDESIYNLLLRENSHLKADYKTLIYSSNKQIFNGLNIQGMWRLIKDIRITNEWLTIAKINRLFYQGYKSYYEIEIPCEKKIEMLERHPEVLGQYPYQELQWHLAFEQFRKVDLDWEAWPKQEKEMELAEISLRGKLDLHQKDHVILFRHFIVYILHIAILQHQQHVHQNQKVSFRKCLEDLLAAVKNPSLGVQVSNMPSMRTEKFCSEVLTNLSHNQAKLSVPDEYLPINRQLLDEFNVSRLSLLNTIDQTVSVRQIYTLLSQCGILKQATEKMLFMERIERSMNIKSSLIRKQNKNNYGNFEKVALTSPHFAHIMNYEMIGSQLDEILFKLLNRKIGNTHSKEEFLKKYKEIIKNMVGQLRQRRTQVEGRRKGVGFKWGRKSSKDRQREELLLKLEEEKKEREEVERQQSELRKQGWERMRMAKEDTDIKDDEESENSEQYYD